MKHILLMAFLAAGTGTFAQKASSQISFKKGQKLELATEVKATMTQSMMGQEMEMNFNTTILRSFDVENVAPAGATIEHKVKRIQFAFDGMGQTQKFDSENEADRKGEMGKSMEKSLKNKYSMVVDSKGLVSSVKADDDNPNKNGPGEPDMMGGLLSQFAGAIEMPKAGDATPFRILPSGDVTKGQTWTDSVTREGTGTTKYTVTDITDSEILVDYSEQSTMKRTQEANGMEVTINMNMKNTGKIILDRKSGLLKQKTSNGEGAGTVDVMGQSVPMTNKFTSVQTVKGH